MEVALVVLWLVVVLSLAAIGTPIAATLFAALPRTGSAMGLPVALAGLALGSFWVGQWRFDGVGIALVLLGLVVASALCVRAGADIDHRAAMEGAVVVGGAFLVMAYLRAGDPAVVPYAGEKFLDYSLIRATLRAEALPPADPWFAGEPVRYYYGGHAMVAALATVTATSAAFAYNLGFAVVVAGICVAAYGLAGELSASMASNPRVGGLFGVGFVAIAGNLASPLRFIGWLLPGGLSDRWASWWDLGEGGLLDGPGSFHYWDDSRVIPADHEAIDYLINEFPAFAFLHGDLHAHVISMMFVLVGATLAFAGYRSESLRYRGGVLVAIGAIVALLAITNTWSVITMLGLVAVTAALAPTLPWELGGSIRPEGSIDPRRLGGRAGIGVGVLAVTVVVGLVLAAPWIAYTRADSGIGLFPSRSPLRHLVIIYGGFLAVVVPAVIDRYAPDVREAAIAIGVAISALAIASLLGIAGLLAFGSLVVLTAWLIVTRDTWSYALVLVVAGAGLVAVLELVYVDDPGSWERLNTVFKLGVDAWLLWGVAAGALLAGWLEQSAPSSLPRLERRTWGVVLVVVLVVALGMYGALAVASHTETAREQPTLDATVFLHEMHPEEAGAIAYLDDVAGTPTLAEAPGDNMYQWTNAPSSFTALPSVAGWAHAADYQDAHEAFTTRVADLETLYTGADAERQAIIDTYDIEYIYAGPNERQRYGTLTVQDDPALEVVYEEAGVTIYRVT